MVRRGICQTPKSVLKYLLSVDRNAEAAGSPIEHEMVDRAPVPLDAWVGLARMVAGVIAANAAVAPNELQSGIGIGALLEMHLPGVIAEHLEAVEGISVAHREPLQILPVRLAFFSPEVRDVKLDDAVSAGVAHVVVDAVVH